MDEFGRTQNLAEQAKEILMLPPEVLRNTERNLLNDFTATVNAMAEIEGNEWLKSTMEGIYENDAKFVLDRLRLKKTESTQVINGFGGWNRWFVDSDGDVRLSVHHITGNKNKVDEILVKARTLGFGLAL